MKNSNFIKTTCPQIKNTLRRKRLFEQLQTLKQSAISWITAPPGSGKTTLVSSYLIENQITHLWYQVTPDDSDIANFFHYLGLAIQNISSSPHPPLPALTPEYLPSLKTFTRRYVEMIAMHVEAPCTIVLDNYEQLPADAPLHSVVLEVASFLPKDMNIIVLSRTDPPPVFARLRLHNDMKMLKGTSLNLTQEEAQAFAELKGYAMNSDEDKAHLEQIFLQSQGWITGFNLMLPTLKESVTALPDFTSNKNQILFDYFAVEIFEQFNATEQLALLKTSLLPAMTQAQAIALSGDNRIISLLGFLQQQNYFVLCHYSPEMTYEYHALFRDFLLQRAKSHFTPSKWQELQQQSATVLMNNGQTIAAANLYMAAQDWQGLAAMALREAMPMIVSGRHQTLQHWLSSLPETETAHIPWLVFWLGMAQLPFNPPQARRRFEQAYRNFKEQNDPVGLYSTWASIMDSFFFESCEFAGIDPWVSEMEQLRVMYPQFPGIEIEMRVYSTISTFVFRCPQHPFVTEWAEKAFSLWDPHKESHLTVPLGALMISYFVWSGQPAKAKSILERMDFIAKLPDVPPMFFIMYCVSTVLYHGSHGEIETAQQAVANGIAMAERTGLHVWDVLLYGQATAAALFIGDVESASISVSRMAERLSTHNKTDNAYYFAFLANISAERGDWQLSVEQANRAIQLYVEAGTPFVEACCLLRLTQTFLLMGKLVEANEQLERVHSGGLVTKIPVLQYLVLLTEAQANFAQGNESEGLQRLNEALTQSRLMDGAIMSLDSPISRFLKPLYQRALAAGIEVEHVRTLIRRRRLTPDDPLTAPENWPWPIHIYTLGRFEIHYNDQPLSSSGKTQHKPLELLKCLCALGGNSVNQNLITDALWPEAEGDAAEQALRTTLFRLRKLLKHEQAIKLDNRQLSINSHYIRIDALVFDRIAHSQEKSDRSLMLTTLKRYHGHFLAGESATWALVFRERLRAQYIKMAEHAGALLEQDSDWPSAIDCYLHALEIEPLAEIFYRRLMNCYAESGRIPEALNVYQRCRHTLLRHLGVSPTQETQALFHKLSSK